MPGFSNSFTGNNCSKKLSDNELIRAIRFNISAEFEAIQLYEQLAESTDNSKVKTLLLEIADDEREHVGNLSFLLKTLSPKDEKFYIEGVKEAKEIINSDS